MPRAEALERWIADQLEQAPHPSDATMRRVSAALFGAAPPGREAHEEPIPAANPVSGSNLPHIAPTTGGNTSAEAVVGDAA